MWFVILLPDFNIEGNGLQGAGLFEHGFAYCWSGARANVGITGGRYCFSCKIVSAQPVDMDDTPLDKQHVCRIGISRGDDQVGRKPWGNFAQLWVWGHWKIF